MTHDSLRSWWHRWLRATRRRRRPSAPAQQRHSHLQVECLEGRWVPSTVTNLNDAGAGSLRQAILDTPAGGTVDFQDGLTGTIVLTTGALNITASLTIAGPGADRITVSGNHQSNVFNIFPGPNSVITIAALTIADGSATIGGGICNSGANLTVSNSILSGNSAPNYGRGGGIYNSGANLTVINSILTDNAASSDGGGIYNYSGSLTVSNSTFSGNSALQDGGGIYNAFYGTLTVNSSTFRGNSAGVQSAFYGGGGIYNVSFATLTNSTLSGNSAGIYGAGGGIFNYTMLTVSNSTVSGNSAYEGGGILNAGSMLTVSNATVSGNSASFDGGGIFNFSSSLNMGNTITAANTAPTAPDIDGSLGSQGYNLIGDGTGGSGYTATDLVGTAANPIDPRLGPLQDNGGATQTRALLPGSPALTAGNPTQLGVADQRGVVRSGGVNIGSYQASASTLVLTAPATVMSGVPFNLAVAAVDPFGQAAIGYTGTVTFTTSDGDPAVALPADYTFRPSPRRGVAFFPSGATLITTGDQTITATDTVNGTITGTAVVTVNSPAPPPDGSANPSSTPTRITDRTPACSGLPGHEMVAVDRLFASLNQRDARIALPQPIHYARAQAGSWALDSLGGDELVLN